MGLLETGPACGLADAGAHAKSAAVVKRGVAGKYQSKREAEVNGWKAKVAILEQLNRSDDGSAGGAGQRK